MPAPNLTADEATTIEMIKAFDYCQDECNVIQQTVDAAASRLFQTWGGVAANKYSDAITGWQEGFNQVRQGLNMLNESMVNYSNITASTEDNALTLGSSWATAVTSGSVALEHAVSYTSSAVPAPGNTSIGGLGRS